MDDARHLVRSGQLRRCTPGAFVVSVVEVDGLLTTAEVVVAADLPAGSVLRFWTADVASMDLDPAA
jgi:hypothetical protein